MTEAELLKLCLLEAGSQTDFKIWRNESCGAWAGQGKRFKNGDVLVKKARFIQAGLCKGSSDLIGVGPGGTFFAPEIKTPRGKVSKDQKNYTTAVESAGGYAPMIRSVEEMQEAIEYLRHLKG